MVLQKHVKNEMNKWEEDRLKVHFLLKNKFVTAILCNMVLFKKH